LTLQQGQKNTHTYNEEQNLMRYFHPFGMMIWRSKNRSSSMMDRQQFFDDF
jgi:hypothetical protein